MANLNTCKKNPSGNIILPKGRLVYPALFEPALPRGEKDEDKKRYQATVLLPEDADLSIVKADVKALIEENIPEAKRKSAKVKLPFLATADSESLAEYAEDFPVMIRCQAKFKPDVVTPKADRPYSEEEAPDEVYGGRWCRLSVRPFFWSHETGGKGVSLGLQNAQMLDHDDAIGGSFVRGTDEFESASDGLEDLE